MAESRPSPKMKNPECGEKLTDILQEDYVSQDWMPLFKEPDSNNRTLLDLLRSSISDVEVHLADHKEPMIPEKSKLLLALSRCPPKDVKVVIMGHYPTPKDNMATGFALSCPPKEFIDKNVGNPRPSWKNKSIVDLHTVLVKAGYLDRGATYDGCHEVWAERGVLLLNGALTYDFFGKHFDMWKEFVSQLLFLVATHSKRQPVFFLCWGDNAMKISKKLHPELVSVKKTQIIDDGDHSTKVDGSAQCVIFVGHYPTKPKEEDGNNFIPQATNQFKAIKKCYPDLFKLEQSADGS